MRDNTPTKMSQTTTPPVARSGAGDISERELSRERSTLHTTPPARLQPVHPKKQLFNTPLSKFTAKPSPPSPNLVRIKTCLEDLRKLATPRLAKIGPKALSMEDLTPSKRVRKERKDAADLSSIESPAPPLNSVEQLAAARIGRFMLTSVWRRRREEVRCLRKTMEAQVSYSERLRIQVSTLKSLLDSDNVKVRLAIRELERLKQLLKDKEAEKAVLEREKFALENDVCKAEDRASEISVGWRNCRNELECVHATASATERALSLERAAVAEARMQRDLAYQRLKSLEEELAQHESLLTDAENEVAALRREADERQAAMERTYKLLDEERDARQKCTLECALLNLRVNNANNETKALTNVVKTLQEEIARLDGALKVTREQLEWWPKPLTKMLGAARCWLRQGGGVSDAVMWSLAPARIGC